MQFYNKYIIISTMIISKINVSNLNFYLQNHMVYLCTDGAAVNLGASNGLVALLKRDNVEWLKAIHCFNHRLELGVKDALTKTFLNNIIEMLQDLYYVYEKSPKRLRNLRELAEVLDDEVHKPERSHGTRWLAHKARACNTLLKSYNVIVTHIEQLATENGKDKSRFKAYHKKLTSLKFVAYLLLFEATLQPLSQLSLSLQGSVVDLVFAKTQLDHFYVQTDLLTRNELPDIKSVLNSKEYKGIKLQDQGQAESISNHFFADCPVIIEKLVSCVRQRFDDLESEFISAVCNILQTQLWPSEPEVLKDFGMTEIETLTLSFQSLLQLNKIDIDKIKTEFTLFKMVYSKQLSHLKNHKELWAKVLSVYRDKFENFSHLIEILLIFPVSNALVERGFSVMRRMKTDWRNGLNESTLDNLMRIKIHGPDPAQFDPAEAVANFFSVPRRPFSGTYLQNVSKKRKLVEMLNDE
jgi:hypothetical protein